VFTDHERQYFWKRFGPEEEAFTKVDAISQFLAGRYGIGMIANFSSPSLRYLRFAAKEACRKACKQMNSNSRGFQHIVILPVASPGASAHQSSRPQGLILDKPYEVWQDAVSTPQGRVDINELDGQLCEISISHDGDFATAVAIVPST
jgi:holo-[acyl-carrier protein] synthase